MTKKIIEGDTRRFLVINTTRYNLDDKYTVHETDFAGTQELGFIEPKHQRAIDDLHVGDILGQHNEFCPYKGLYVMRVA